MTDYTMFAALLAVATLCFALGAYVARPEHFACRAPVTPAVWHTEAE